jgi:hypothetical protein
MDFQPSAPSPSTTMERPAPTTSSQPVERTNFQSIDDFMKEQDNLDAIKHVETKTSVQAMSLPRKKVKIDVEVQALEARAIDECGETNWVGKLSGRPFIIEYRAANPPQGALIYVDGLVGTAPPRFTCSVTLDESALTFGDNVSFSKKRDAKQYAAKKAIDWLIESKRMPADGSVRFPRTQSPATPNKAKAADAVGQHDLCSFKSKTLASQVPELCIRLGFNIPKYEITRVSENVPLYSGYAHFNGDPRIEGKVGEVKDVYGQKNAKEKIAEVLVSFLRDIERQRIESYDKGGS